ncbi:MAG: ATP-binding protein [Desulfuromonadaceae bacterium]|nr:ATP-binding protein [Desulfuromonadaceae bacterium]MDD2848745.1 ATP-binding protein [Desulfuromonadaceae bacterium]MDD4130395.1 ATP-binding protein [Desulfuromonadaceae bacterium]
MRCNLRCRFLLLFVLISVIALSSAFVLRALIMRDFARYLEGESQDRIHRVVALIEGGYDHNAGWKRDALATDLAWALQLGVEARLFDSGGRLVIDTEQAASSWTPLMRKRVLESSGYDPRVVKGIPVPYPLYLRDDEIGRLEVRMLGRLKEDYFVSSSERVLLVSVTILGLVSIIAGIIASRRVTRPILELVATSGDIAGGDLSRRVTIYGNDEIGRLSESFNLMAHGLEAQEKLRRTLLSNAAHELRTPLAIISGELEGMLDNVLPTDRSALQSLYDEARRLTAILDGVDELSLAEAGTLNLHKETLILKPYLTAIVGRFERTFADKDAVLLLECPDDLRINADPDRLSQIIINLVSNSLKAVASGGRVVLVASCENSSVRLQVIDNGCGIPEEDLPHVFERFYKGKNGGLGLGLAIVQELVTAHGGTLSVRSSVGSGTSFSVVIP